ncbi:MAG: peptide MFS transporter [Candidatus Latescibacterota bacterium]|nr:MAG: peptide MFS transporter [Candidatus Latescibacterota bacterium]
MNNSATRPAHEKQWLGHPRGLSTLFFTELWERFSYYGMRALLILYMTARHTDGGLEFDVAIAGAIYAVYTASGYMLSLPGGWIADNLLGHRKSVIVGGIMISAGNFMLATPSIVLFYVGLATIAMGTGLLKPNASTMVGMLYKEGDARRDSGFSIYYMGINIGAFSAPLICSFIGEQINWHLAFVASGVGMIVGLIQYVYGTKYLGEAGKHPAPAKDDAEKQRRVRNFVIGIGSIAAIIVLIIILDKTGTADITVERVANAFGIVLALIAVLTFAWIFMAGHWTRVERNRLLVIVLLFFCAALFWGAFEQHGSSINLFARDHTNRVIFGWEFPAGYFQSLNALFIVIFAGVFAWLWLALGRRNREPSSPSKFAIGLLLVGLGYFIMVAAAFFVSGGGRVSPFWLVTAMLFHTFGELALSPVGLSTVTKLAPARVAGLMMGVWFLAGSVGNYMGGRLAGFYETLPLPKLFAIVALVPIAAGLLLFMFVRPIKRLMGGVN